MSVSLTLQERLKQQHQAESETIQSLTAQQLSTLRSELNGILRQELNTIRDDMREQLRQTSEEFRENQRNQMLSLLKNRVLFPALSTVTVLAAIFMSGWGVSTLQESRIAVNWQQINEQNTTLSHLEKATDGLNIVQDEKGTFVVLPKGATAEQGWKIGKDNALKITR